LLFRWPFGRRQARRSKFWPWHQPDPGLWPAARNRIHHPIAVRLEGQGVDADIINAGVSGDTADGLSRLDWSLADHPGAAILDWAPTTC